MRFLVIFLLTLNSYAGDMKLIGKAMLEFSVFKIDVYEISYYKGPNNTEELLLDYKREVEKKYSIQGWEKGLQPVLEKSPNLQEKAKWLIESAITLKEGDKLILRKQQDNVTILKNEKVISKIKDQQIADLLFYPWLGEKPIDQDLKKKLLGSGS